MRGAAPAATCPQRGGRGVARPRDGARAAPPLHTRRRARPRWPSEVLGAGVKVKSPVGQSAGVKCASTHCRALTERAICADVRWPRARFSSRSSPTPYDPGATSASGASRRRSRRRRRRCAPRDELVQYLRTRSEGEGISNRGACNRSTSMPNRPTSRTTTS